MSKRRGRITRREFVGTTLAAAGVFAGAPALLRGRNLNNKLDIAFIAKEVARYAERYGVVVGLEDWISAEDNIKLIDAIGSDHVAVYYDAHNIVPRVKDIYVEPKMLGRRIHQIHVKNAEMLLSTPGGRLNWPRMAQEFYDIGYRGWYVLETGSPSKDIVADTRANIEYVKKTFRMPPAV